MFIDGDFKTKKPCKYHCSPTCHPAQTGPEWVYGCTHIAWPQNKNRDFVPIVRCNGEFKNCEIPTKLMKYTINGKKRRIRNLQKSMQVEQKLLDEYEQFFNGLTNK